MRRLAARATLGALAVLALYGLNCLPLSEGDHVPLFMDTLLGLLLFAVGVVAAAIAVTCILVWLLDEAGWIK